MTRKEQILEAANTCEAEDHWNVPSFIIGAEWADFHPDMETTSQFTANQMRENLRLACAFKVATNALEFYAEDSTSYGNRAREAIKKIRIE